jgi:hypothetical protein
VIFLQHIPEIRHKFSLSNSSSSNTVQRKEQEATTSVLLMENKVRRKE